MFEDKVFKVPDYQRTYSWEMEQIKDFWNDIKESMMTETKHYWGTITLRPTGEFKSYNHERFKVFEIVDGQQRITTIYLFLLAFSKKLEKPEEKKEYISKFIKYGDVYKLELGSLNNQFLKDLVDGKNPQPTIKTNKLLKEALNYFEKQLEYHDSKSIDLSKILVHLKYETFSLEFRVTDESLAIKTFQSLNDRGKELTLLDKVKSFLMFYSSRYLKGDLISSINTVFGNILTNYDIIKGLGEEEEIDYISGKRFTEDEVLRLFYHYFAQYAINKYKLGYYDYDITSEEVFKIFLKETCEKLKNNPISLKNFINDFLESFNEFVEAFKRVISRVKENCQYKKLFSFLGLSVRLYPLIISLECEGLLDQKMLKTIERIDVRIYKIRGTDIRAGLYREAISQIKIIRNAEQIHSAMENFINSNMSDDNFKRYLREHWLYDNPVVKYILWEFEKAQTPSFNDCDYSFYKKLEVDHIFPREPTFSFPACGFKDAYEYDAEIEKIGNLTLLEKEINIKVGNRPPERKINEYLYSRVQETKKIALYIQNYGWSRKDVEDRKEKIVEFCVKRW